MPNRTTTQTSPRETRSTTAQQQLEKPAATPASANPPGTQGGRVLSREQADATGPFGAAGRLMRDMDRSFRDFAFGGQHPSAPQTLSSEEGVRGLEFREQDGRLVVRADLPGFDPGDVQVHVEDDMLTIRGERRREGEQAGVYHCERSYSRWTIALPRGLDPNAIEAKFDDGRLEISAPIPKPAQTRGQNVEVRPSNPNLGATPSQPKPINH